MRGKSNHTSPRVNDIELTIFYYSMEHNRDFLFRLRKFIFYHFVNHWRRHPVWGFCSP